MLRKLKTIFGRSENTALDFVFHPWSSEPFRLSALPTDSGAVAFGATGSGPWFSPTSESHRQVLMCDPKAVLETDSPHVLETISQTDHAPHHHCVIFQPWHDSSRNGKVRWLGAMSPEMGAAIGKAVAGSSIQHLYLATGGVGTGALNALAGTLDGHQLETLGVFWHFSGDDMTDDPKIMDELSGLCATCGAKRMSILTAAVDTTSEDRLVAALAGAPHLSECSVFEKDDHARYSRFRTPTLDAFLAQRTKP